jgi:RNA recognition motif-containing protein
MNIFVGSLPFSIEESRLQELFEEFGEVNSVKIISDKFSGRSKGFGFVEMPDDDQAKNAINELNGSDLDGRKIVVNQAEERKPDSRRGGFGGDDRRGGGGGFNKGGGGGRGGYGNKGGGGGGGYRSSY